MRRVQVQRIKNWTSPTCSSVVCGPNLILFPGHAILCNPGFNGSACHGRWTSHFGRTRLAVNMRRVYGTLLPVHAEYFTQAQAGVSECQSVWRRRSQGR